MEQNIDTDESITPVLNSKQDSQNDLKIKKFQKLPVGVIVVLILSIVIVVCMLVMGGGITKQSSETEARQLAFEYLNTKYGDGAWQIHESIRDAGYTLNGFVKSEYDNGYIFRVTSAYTNGISFVVDVDDTGIITTDSFLPTYYSIKYGLNFTAPEEGNMTTYKYDDLIKRMVYITDYHYPYNDYKYSSSGSISQRPKARIKEFEMSSFYDPISVMRSPEQSKVLDIIPSNSSIPDIMDIIKAAEDYYSSGLIRNNDEHEKELFSLVFEEKASSEIIESFIADHISSVDGYEPMYQYRQKEAE